MGRKSKLALLGIIVIGVAAALAIAWLPAEDSFHSRCGRIRIGMEQREVRALMTAIREETLQDPRFGKQSGPREWVYAAGDGSREAEMSLC